jgi:hypothetical protein
MRNPARLGPGRTRVPCPRGQRAIVNLTSPSLHVQLQTVSLVCAQAGGGLGKVCNLQAECGLAHDGPQDVGFEAADFGRGPGLLAKGKRDFFSGLRDLFLLCALCGEDSITTLMQRIPGR